MTIGRRWALITNTANSASRQGDSLVKHGPACRSLDSVQPGKKSRTFDLTELKPFKLNFIGETWVDIYYFYSKFTSFIWLIITGVIRWCSVKRGPIKKGAVLYTCVCTRFSWGKVSTPECFWRLENSGKVAKEETPSGRGFQEPVRGIVEAGLMSLLLDPSAVVNKTTTKRSIVPKALICQFNRFTAGLLTSFTYPPSWQDLKLATKDCLRHDDDCCTGRRRWG